MRTQLGADVSARLVSSEAMTLEPIALVVYQGGYTWQDYLTPTQARKLSELLLDLAEQVEPLRAQTNA